MMNLRQLLPVCILLLIASVAPAAAQSGFALKGHYVFNSSKADGYQGNRIPAADGLGIGLEYVLPLGLSVGVNGYTAERRLDTDLFTRDYTVLAEANYFLKLPILPLAPYAGVHAGLGTYKRENVGELATDPRFKDTTGSQLGYQFGVRFQPSSLIGFDAQYRRISESARVDQSTSFEQSQILLGITLF
jgi:hypothetical protein